MRRWKHLGKMGLAFVLAVGLIFPAYGTQDGIKDAKGKITSMEEEKKKLEQDLKQLEVLKSDTAAYVKQLDNKLAGIEQELTVLEGQIAAKETDIATTQEELTQAQATEETQYDSMKLRIKYMYEKGETSYIDMIMQSQSMSELLNRTEYVTKISEYDREQMDIYIATREAIAQKEAQLQTERTELLTMQDSTLAKQASAEQLVNEKSAELANYNSKITDAESRIDEYQKDIEAQEDSIKKMEAEIKRKEEEAKKKAEQAGKKYNTVSIGNIKFKWPCPASSRITSSFGGRDRPTEGASTNHKGIDIGASSGSNIIAAAAGEVVISTYSYSAGNYIMINHGGGVYSVYMNCSKLLASVGDQVKQGQVIAKVGSTGYSTGPHLHFGIRVNGTYVNPTKYVSP